jgi:hypothetical protein
MNLIDDNSNIIFAELKWLKSVISQRILSRSSFYQQDGLLIYIVQNRQISAILKQHILILLPGTVLLLTKDFF